LLHVRQLAVAGGGLDLADSHLQLAEAARVAARHGAAAVMDENFPIGDARGSTEHPETAADGRSGTAGEAASQSEGAEQPQAAADSAANS